MDIYSITTIVTSILALVFTTLSIRNYFLSRKVTNTIELNKKYYMQFMAHLLTLSKMSGKSDILDKQLTNDLLKQTYQLTLNENDINLNVNKYKSLVNNDIALAHFIDTFFIISLISDKSHKLIYRKKAVELLKAIENESDDKFKPIVEETINKLATI